MRLRCQGDPGCPRSVGKNENKAGWMVVNVYPLDDDDDEGTRRHICCACARRLAAVFRGR